MASRGEPDSGEAFRIGRVVAFDDQEAFADLVRLHQSPVRQFLRRLVGTDWSRADDLAQETFWKAYRHLASFRGEGRFLSWLFRIAYQEFVSDQRRRRGLVESPLLDVAAVDDPAERLVARRTCDQLLERLRPEERAAIVLHYQHGLTHAELADVLDLPLGTVKSLIRRGRHRLQAGAGELESPR